MARYNQECLCLPSDKDFSNGLEIGGIKECGVICRHINIASKTYGSSKHAVKGRSVQQTNKMPQDSITTGALSSIVSRYGEVTLGLLAIPHFQLSQLQH